MSPLFQVACAAIVALSVAIALARTPARARLAGRLALLVLASWLGEDTMIRFEDAYEYSPSWSGFVDRVPVLIPLIWPIVVYSAWRLARGLLPGASVARIALLGAFVVLTDAAFIEPLAVSAGLWHWKLPGPFAVPMVGILGWSYFSAAAIAWLESRERGTASLDRDLSVLLLAPLAAHALVLASWWGAFRWITVVPGERTAVATAWSVSVVICVVVIVRGPRRHDGKILAELIARLPGASVFFLLILGLSDSMLRAYAIAFIPPYLVLVANEVRTRSGQEVGKA